MSGRLSTEQVEHFSQQGYLFPLPLLAPDEVTRYRAAIEDLEARFGSRPERLSQLHLSFRWAYDLATHPALLDVIESILGGNILVQSTTVFCKQARDPGFVVWHQDGTFIRTDAKPSISVFIALGECTPESGCLRVIPRTHTLGKLQTTDNDFQFNLLTKGEEVRYDVDESNVVDLRLHTGEMSLHHINTVHGSGANHTDDKRISFTIRYIDPETPTLKSSLFPAVLARGEDPAQRRTLLDKIPGDRLEDGLASHQEYLETMGVA